jgi:hypothetical protein
VMTFDALSVSVPGEVAVPNLGQILPNLSQIRRYDI